LVDQEAVRRAVQDELARSRARQEAVAVARATVATVRAAAAEEARLSGGPCVYCGVTWSAFSEDGQVKPAWYRSGVGACCYWCECERRQQDSEWGTERPEVEHRDRAVRLLVADESITRFWTGPYLAEKTGFRWWHETPGAEPGGRVRFRYVDRWALRAALRPKRPTAAEWYTAAAPCERCGCAYMWRSVSDYKDLRTNKNVAGPLVCHGCVDFESIEDVASRLVGVNGRRYGTSHHKIGTQDHFYDTQNAVAAIGLTWFNKRDTSKDPRRRDLTLTPFTYLDVPALRRRAYELFPQPDAWLASAVWQRLRDEAEARR